MSSNVRCATLRGGIPVAGYEITLVSPGDGAELRSHVAVASARGPFSTTHTLRLKLDPNRRPRQSQEIT